MIIHQLTHDTVSWHRCRGGRTRQAAPQGSLSETSPAGAGVYKQILVNFILYMLLFCVGSVQKWRVTEICLCFKAGPTESTSMAGTSTVWWRAARSATLAMICMPSGRRARPDPALRGNTTRETARITSSSGTTSAGTHSDHFQESLFIRCPLYVRCWLIIPYD